MINRIGVSNIAFAGMLGTAIVIKYSHYQYSVYKWYNRDRQYDYYGLHLFKRVKPTETIYEKPY